MKRMWNGIQAVTVELLGVLLVVWMLFGFTALGLHSASGEPPTLTEDVARQLQSWKGQLESRLSGHFPPAGEREPFVANRLDYFSRSYSRAARNHFDGLLVDFDSSAPVASRGTLMAD